MKIILPLNVKDRDIAKIVQIANSTKKDVIYTKSILKFSKKDL